MKGYPIMYNNIIFIETPLNEGERIEELNVDLSFKIDAQLKNLNDVKAKLAAKAAALNCNCVSEFKYGQKSRLLAIDDVAYWGKGAAMQLGQESYNKIADYIRERDSK